jgi:hypothetical protein
MVSENHTEVPEHLETILMQLARNSIYAANPFFEIKAYPSLCIKVMRMAFILLNHPHKYRLIYKVLLHVKEQPGSQKLSYNNDLQRLLIRLKRIYNF